MLNFFAIISDVAKGHHVWKVEVLSSFERRMVINMNAFSKIIAIIITVILLFLTPMLYMAQKQDIISQSYVSSEATKFIDSIKNSGYISIEMYMDFVKKIDATNNLYNIEIVHSHKVVEPLYDENSSTFLEDYDTYYYNTYQDEILEVFDQRKDYEFFQGDYISIIIKNRTKTIATRLMELFYSSDIPDEQILITYGGMIRDEVD